MHHSSLRKYIRVFAILALAVSITACDIGSSGNAPDLPPAQVIEKAAPAIQAATSFHFNMETSKLDTPLPGIFITKASGDVARPDKLSAEVSASYSGIPITIKAIVDGDKQYMTDPTSGAWLSTGLAIDVKQYFNPSQGISDILGSVKNLASDGTESVDNTETYRLTGSVPASALKSLSPEVTAQSELTTTLWIGASDFLLRRVRLQGPLSTGEPADIGRTINFSDYNKPVKIETPAVVR